MRNAIERIAMKRVLDDYALVVCRNAICCCCRYGIAQATGTETARLAVVAEKLAGTVMPQKGLVYVCAVIGT